MKRTRLVKLVRDNRRSAYDVIVNAYSLIVTGWRINLLKRVIEIDLERYTCEKVKLNFFSLSKAVKKFRMKNRDETKVKRR